MKNIFVLGALFLTINLNGQIVNKINKVKELKIYGNSKVEIGTIIVNPTLATKIFLLKSIQTLDSSGVYTTIFILGNNEKLPLFGLDVSLQFNAPIISCEHNSGVSMSIYESMSQDKKGYYLKVSQINRQPWAEPEILRFTIKSFTKIKTTINGIDGKLP